MQEERGPIVAKNGEPFLHDQTQSRHHKGQDEHQEGFCHLLEHLRMAASFSLHSAQCHMRNNQPNHLLKKEVHYYTRKLIW